MANSILAKMAVQITANTAQFNSALADTNRRLSTFEKGLKGLPSALGLAFGAREVFNGIKYGIGVIADFEHQMSEVRAITGATGKQFDALRNNALQLGAATKFSAKEVGGLQVAFGRLGFTTKEILQATKATLDLASATGEDLAKSADVAGSTVRSFGLDASETIRVTDVMAKSFNESALGLENFSEAIKYVAPVAANANISLEQTTALLGVLADAGIRGSQAGTSLRKIISDLGQGAGPILTKRLKELAAAGLSGADAMDEVGRTAYASLLVLAKNTDKVDAAAESYRNAAGSVAAMAKVMQDDLTGDVTKLSRAFDSLILQGSPVSPLLRGITQDLTALIRTIGEAPSIPDALGLLSLVGVSGPGGLEYLKKYNELIDKQKELIDKRNKALDDRDKLQGPQNVDPLTGLSPDGGTPWTPMGEELQKQRRDVDFLRDAISKLNDSIGGMTTRGDVKGAQDEIKKLTIELNALLGITEKVAKVNLKDFGDTLRYSFAPVKNIDQLKTQIKELQEQLEFSNDASKNSGITNQIKEIDAEIQRLTDGISGKKPDWEKFAANFKLPDDLKKMLVKDFQALGDVFVVDIGPAFASFVTDFAQSIGQLIGSSEGMGKFADNIKKSIGSLLQAIGSGLIALGIGKMAVKIPGPAAIAAGVVLVAAGAALSASTKKMGNVLGGGSGGGGSESRPEARVGDYQASTLNITINEGKPIEFFASGEALRAATKKGDYVVGRRG